jgi:P-type Cu2+ transporter
MPALALTPSKPALKPCDEPARWRSFSRCVQADVWQSQVRVQGIVCSTCAPKVQHALQSLPGIVSASVNAMTGRALIEWDAATLRPSDWMRAVARAGYAVVPLGGLELVQELKHAQRSMLWRWLVAGFCMMQVMMYAWPSYTAQPGDMDATTTHILNWASLVLTLPVLLFSSAPFFKSAWLELKQGRVGMDTPVALGIGLTFAVSVLAVLTPTGLWGSHLYFDSVCMLVFFLLSGRYLQAAMKAKVAGQIQGVAEQLPLLAQLQLAPGRYEPVPVGNLQAGDVILVRPGESIAVDGELVSGCTTVDEALLTGEAAPVAKSAGARVVAGSVNIAAPVHVRATHVGVATQLGQISEQMHASMASKTRAMQLADRVAQPFMAAVLVIATLAFLLWWPLDPGRAIQAAIAVLIVSCPCALALAAPAAYLSAASALARQGLLTRSMLAIERLATVDHVVFDKTGTLTLSEPGVTAFDSNPLLPPGFAGAVALQMARHSVHPLSQAIVQYLSEKLGDSADLPAVELASESPGGGVQAQIKGQTYRLGSRSYCEELGPARLEEGANSAESATRVYLSTASRWVASFALSAPLRADVDKTFAAIGALGRGAKTNDGGVSVSLVSGDNAQAVQTLMHKAAPQAPVQVLAACSPADKLAYVQRLHAQGQQVLMVGDGVNDAPVLASADVSISPSSAAALASVRADFVLTSNSLQPIASALHISRRALRVVQQNFVWALAYNAVSLPVAIAGWLTPWLAGLGMAASSSLVLANALRLQKSAKAG